MFFFFILLILQHVVFSNSIFNTRRASPLGAVKQPILKMCFQQSSAAAKTNRKKAFFGLRRGEALLNRETGHGSGYEKRASGRRRETSDELM